MLTTLCFYLYPIQVFLKTLATTSYALLVFYVLHVASPGINEANCFIISHVACKYTYLKKHSSFSFIALSFMPLLSEHQPSGAIGMLKAGVRVSDVARYHYCLLSTIQSLKDCYQATGTVKDRRRSGQPKMATGFKIQLTSIVYPRYLHQRYPFQPAIVSARGTVGLKGNLFLIFK